MKVAIPRVWLYKHLVKVVEKRKSEKVIRKDYMQLLLDSESSVNEIDSSNKENNLTGIHLNKKMNKNVIEILINQ